MLRILRNTGWNLAGQGIPVFAALIIIPLLLPEKAAVLHLAMVVFIAYALHLGSRGLPIAAALHGRILLVVLLAFIPTALSYFVYFKLPSDTVRSMFDQFLFRIIGV